MSDTLDWVDSSAFGPLGNLLLSSPGFNAVSYKCYKTSLFLFFCFTNYCLNNYWVALVDAFYSKKCLDKTCHRVVFSHTSDISLPCIWRYTSLAAASLASFLFLPVPSGYFSSPTKKWQCLLKCRSYWVHLQWQVSHSEWNEETAQRLTAEHHLVPELVTQQPSLTTCSYDQTRLTSKHS